MKTKKVNGNLEKTIITTLTLSIKTSLNMLRNERRLKQNKVMLKGKIFCRKKICSTLPRHKLL